VTEPSCGVICLTATPADMLRRNLSSSDRELVNTVRRIVWRLRAGRVGVIAANAWQETQVDSWAAW
jgi:hypothetical protein